MPRKRNTGSRKPNEMLGGKKLNPWLAKRFAERALSLSRGYTISFTTLPLTTGSGQRYLGANNGGLARRVVNRAGSALPTWRVADLPLASRVSDSVLRKLTLVQTGWQSPLNLPSVQQRQRQGGGSEPTAYATPDGQPAADTGSRLQSRQWFRQAPSLPASEEKNFAYKTVRTYSTVKEKPLPLTNTDSFASPAAAPQQQEGSDAPESPPGIQSRIPKRGIYQRDGTLNIAHGQVDGLQERPAQVRQQPQHADLPQLLSGGLTPITRQMTLQRSLVGGRRRTIEASISDRHASKIRSAYEPEEAYPEAQSSPVTGEQAVVLSLTNLPPVQSSGDTTVHDEHTLSESDMAFSERPAMLPSKVLPDLERSMSKPTIADEVSRRLVNRRETLDAGIEVNRRRDRGSAEEYTEEVLPSPHALSITGSTITPLSMTKGMSRTMAMPSRQPFKEADGVSILGESEDYGFPQGREYERASPSYMHARQPAPALPVTAPAPPRAESSAAPSEELFRYTSDAMSEITHSRNHNGLELALAPISRAPETKAEARVTAPEHRADTGEEKEATPDIRALAREVYPLIRRMVMIERDRHPTWY